MAVAEFDIKGKDEVASLGHSFNLMISIYVVYYHSVPLRSIL